MLQLFICCTLLQFMLFDLRESVCNHNCLKTIIVLLSFERIYVVMHIMCSSETHLYWSRFPMEVELHALIQCYRRQDCSPPLEGSQNLVHIAVLRRTCLRSVISEVTFSRILLDHGVMSLEILEDD